jgi:hypothetical protein
MSRQTMSRFTLSSPLLRTLFAAVAVAASLGTGVFIDALAHGYGFDDVAPSQVAAIVIAQR